MLKKESNIDLLVVYGKYGIKEDFEKMKAQGDLFNYNVSLGEIDYLLQVAFPHTLMWTVFIRTSLINGGTQCFGFTSTKNAIGFINEIAKKQAAYIKGEEGE